MRKYRVQIIYNNQIWLKIAQVEAKSQYEAETKCFEYVDALNSGNSQYKPELVELYFLDNPRHQLLFFDLK